MIIEKGTTVSDVCKQLTQIFKIIDLCLYETGNHFIIIGTRRGHDSFRITHETGLAIDIKPPLLNSEEVFFKLKTVIGCNYLVQKFENHWHIEFSPVGLAGLKNKQKNAEMFS